MSAGATLDPGFLLNHDVTALWERRSRLMAARATEHPRPWYRIQNATPADDTAEIYIYDAIGGWLGVSAAEFVHELRGITAAQLLLHLNSPGGDAWDGIAIYTALRDSVATVTVKVDSLAASAASVIAMAGDRLVMSPASTLMVHQAWGMVIGNAADMEKEAEILTKLNRAIAGIYQEKAGGTVTDWLAIMAEETWYTDQEAVGAGLADEVAAPSSVARLQRLGPQFDLSIFNHPPTTLAAAPPEPRLPPDPRWLDQLTELEAAVSAAKES